MWFYICPNVRELFIFSDIADVLTSRASYSWRTPSLYHLTMYGMAENLEPFVAGTLRSSTDLIYLALIDKVNWWFPTNKSPVIEAIRVSKSIRSLILSKQALIRLRPSVSTSIEKLGVIDAGPLEVVLLDVSHCNGPVSRADTRSRPIDIPPGPNLKHLFLFQRSTVMGNSNLVLLPPGQASSSIIPVLSIKPSILEQLLDAPQLVAIDFWSHSSFDFGRCEFLGNYALIRSYHRSDRTYILPCEGKERLLSAKR